MSDAKGIKKVTSELLEMISSPLEKMIGAFNIREDSGCAARHSTENIRIESKKDKPGLEIHVAPGTKGETVFIPAVVTHGGIEDVAYNDFFIGEDADVVVTAGCGVHTSDGGEARHDGIHRFFIGRGAHVVYLEKHIGTGEGIGSRVINPKTEFEIEDGGCLEMDTTQIKGIDSTVRTTIGVVRGTGKLVIREKIMTHESQIAETNFKVDLDGDGSAADVVSRSVARGESHQLFRMAISGNAPCTGHSACDAIIMDKGVVSAIPELTAKNVDAALVHEAAIGKIAGDQLIKLMTLGLTEQEAEERIIEGFLSN